MPHTVNPALDQENPNALRSKTALLLTYPRPAGCLRSHRCRPARCRLLGPGRERRGCSGSDHLLGGTCCRAGQAQGAGANPAGTAPPQGAQGPQSPQPPPQRKRGFLSSVWQRMTGQNDQATRNRARPPRDQGNPATVQGSQVSSRTQAIPQPDAARTNDQPPSRALTESDPADQTGKPVAQAGRPAVRTTAGNAGR